MTVEEKKFLCSYDLTSQFLKQIPFKIIELQPLNYGFKIITSKKIYFLKKLRYSLLEWEYINSYKKHIEEQTNIKVPKNYPIKNKNHNELLYWENSWYEVIEWIDEEEIDLQNTEHIVKCAKTLSEIHKASKNYKNNYEVLSKNEAEQLPYRLISVSKELLQYYNNIKLKKDRTQFDDFFCSKVNEVIVQIENIYYKLIKNNYYEIIEEYTKNKYLIINNYGKNNIKINKEGMLYITNFDEISYDTFLNDIASFIKKCSKQENTDLNIVKSIIINNYTLENDLSKQEQEWIDFLISIPTGFYKVCKQYYEQNNLSKSEIYLEKLKQEIEFYTQKIYKI